jgi:probable F420-dependent oxidoreductase
LEIIGSRYRRGLGGRENLRQTIRLAWITFYGNPLFRHDGKTSIPSCLSGGRLRLGVGIGWNAVEYEALGKEFGTRGARIEEQIEVMRLLWTREVVSYEGRYHRIDEAGINPLPVQRPIPVWMGARADVGLRRTARVADGWFPLGPPDDRMREAVKRLRGYIEEAGRVPESVGIEARLDVGRVSPEEWITQTETWRSLGATHISVNTMNAGLRSPQEHVETIGRYKEVLGE